MARDLRKDLEICNAATPGRWEAWSFDCSDEGEEPKTGLWVTSEHQPDSAICTFGMDPTEQDYHNARFIAAAREGWSHAIRRAMEAETRVKELEAQAAAMRKAAELGARWMEWWLEYDEPCDCDATGHICGLRDRQRELRQIKKALSSSVGTDLLARMKQLEDNCDALEESCGVFVNRMARLRAKWLEAHPYADYWPDLGAGFEWLMTRLEQLEYVAETAKSLLEDFTNCAGCWTDPCGDNCPVRERITSLREALADLEVGDTDAARD